MNKNESNGSVTNDLPKLINIHHGIASKSFNSVV